jgi:hypothetical protein
VVETARQLLDYVGGTLVVAQTVLAEQYWREIHAGLAAARIPVHHFLLHTDHDTLVQRIETDAKPQSADARRWRLDHLAAYHEALPWLPREAKVIDTTRIPPARVAELVIARTG